MKHVALSGVAACAFIAGCTSYSERVVEKPVPATTTHRTVVTEVPPGPPTAPPMTIHTTTTR